MAKRITRAKRQIRQAGGRFTLPPGHDEGAGDWTPRSLGLAVALHGAPALRLTFPRFAARGGLLDRAA